MAWYMVGERQRPVGSELLRLSSRRKAKFQHLWRHLASGLVASEVGAIRSQLDADAIEPGRCAWDTPLKCVQLLDEVVREFLPMMESCAHAVWRAVHGFLSCAVRPFAPKHETIPPCFHF